MLNDLFQNIYKCYSGFFKINIPVLKNFDTNYDVNKLKYLQIFQ